MVLQHPQVAASIVGCKDVLVTSARQLQRKCAAIEIADALKGVATHKDRVMLLFNDCLLVSYCI